tara:strand:+ start:2830 stop:3855 length:1026 start_codon:yes stop_codon:yes gene_type:complete
MKKYLILLLSLFVLGCTNKNNNKEQITIYTKRHYDVDKDLFKKFEEDYNITVNVVQASADELIERIKTEGDNCPADLLITVDAGKLYKAANEKLLEKINISEINTSINQNLIDKNGYWVPITYRSRVIAYNPEKVDIKDLSTYEDLKDSKWKNRILVRSSSNAYNQALLSSLIAHNGKNATLDWANKISDNFARNPKGNDRDQIRAIYANVGDIAIVNSYYIGLLKSSDDEYDKEIGNAIKVFFPNQGENERGAHVNISGIGLLKNSPNKENALKLIKFLTSEYAQNYYTNNSFEYPVNLNVKPSNIVAEWGEFKIDNLDLNELGIKRKQAIEIFEKSKWD